MVYTVPAKIHFNFTSGMSEFLAPETLHKFGYSMLQLLLPLYFGYRVLWLLLHLYFWYRVLRLLLPLYFGYRMLWLLLFLYHYCCGRDVIWFHCDLITPFLYMLLLYEHIFLCLLGHFFLSSACWSSVMSPSSKWFLTVHLRMIQSETFSTQVVVDPQSFGIWFALILWLQLWTYNFSFSVCQLPFENVHWYVNENRAKIVGGRGSNYGWLPLRWHQDTNVHRIRLWSLMKGKFGSARICSLSRIMCLCLQCLILLSPDEKIHMCLWVLSFSSCSLAIFCVH